ncbi:hypothetical protein ACFE04_006749 [Oxalis oulophora]
MLRVENNVFSFEIVLSADGPFGVSDFNEDGIPILQFFLECYAKLSVMLRVENNVFSFEIVLPTDGPFGLSDFNEDGIHILQFFRFLKRKMESTFSSFFGSLHFHPALREKWNFGDI